MSKDPAFLFYSDNFQSGTQFLSDEQIGKYIRLLCAQHLHGHLEEKHMLFICKSYDKDIWDKFDKDDVGKFYNVRLEKEILKRKAYSESRSNNRKDKIKKVKKTSKTYVKHMENENEDVNSTVLTDMDKVFFKWKEYRSSIKKPIHKASMEAAKNKLIKLSGNNPVLAKEIVDDSIANGYQGLFELKKKFVEEVSTARPYGAKDFGK